ncbi:MAG: hypothetical protein N2652_02475 [Kiritimatiellae bacterium]|nr:hypothetical protein [Kiritimatiellia bacterium]
MQAGAIARRVAAIAGAALLAGGCATTPLEAARENYRLGRYDRADTVLSADPAEGDRDRVLVLMERGMIRHRAGRYEESSRDWIAAAERSAQLETYSLSRGAASWVVNDTVHSYRGAPFERTLLHSLTALNHFALARWDEAGVEARRTIDALDAAERDGFPRDAFSAYVAGVALELLDDPSNAQLLYRRAADAAPPGVAVDAATGRLGPRAASTNDPPSPAEPLPRAGWTGELICFVLLGELMPAAGGIFRPSPGYVDIRIGGHPAGRSWPLADVAVLSALTEERLAAMRAAKTVARVMLKDVIAGVIEDSTNNSGLGDLVRLIWIGLLERPDLRRWETLPRSLQVARVRCPPRWEPIEVVYRAANGATLGTVTIAAAPPRRRDRFVMLVHDDMRP